MRALGRAAALVGVASCLSVTITGLSDAPASAEPSATESWAPDLAGGEPTAVTVAGGSARFVAAQGDPDRIGLLTFPPRRLAAPVDRITASLDGDVPAGGTATVETRVRRVSQAWTEWQPVPTGRSVRPDEPSRDVQVRLVLTGGPGAEPSVRGISITARTVAAARTAAAVSPALRYRVFATREGLVGGTTANGHVIVERDHFVALPSRRALSQRGKDDYSVQVCVPSGRCAWAPVWDVGPWNTHDDYWNPAEVRENWAQLPQGVPAAQAAFLDGFNGGLDGFGRRVRNPAGIDLADGLFWDALGLTDNAWVQVTLLWTGSTPLVTVRSAGAPVPVRSAPADDAAQVGLAADSAGIPVLCRTSPGSGPEWLQIGAGAFIRADAAPAPAEIAACV